MAPLKKKERTGLSLTDHANKVQLLDIPIDLIDDYEDNPLPVIDDSDVMKSIMATVDANNGEVRTPLTVSRKPDGRYKCLSGHQRKRALELLGYKTVSCFVHPQMDEESEKLTVVESNIARKNKPWPDQAHEYITGKNALSSIREKGPAHEKYDAYFKPDEKTGKIPTEIEVLAKLTSMSEVQVYKYLNVFALPDKIKDLGRKDKITLDAADILRKMETKSLDALADYLEKSGESLDKYDAANFLQIAEEKFVELDSTNIEKVLAKAKKKTQADKNKEKKKTTTRVTNPDKQKVNIKENVLLPIKNLKKVIPDYIQPDQYLDTIFAALRLYFASKEDENDFEKLIHADEVNESDLVDLPSSDKNQNMIDFVMPPRPRK